MTKGAFDRKQLEKLNRKNQGTTDAPQSPENGISTPSRERVRKAIREANDPKRLISDPQNFDPRK